MKRYLVWPVIILFTLGFIINCGGGGGGGGGRSLAFKWEPGLEEQQGAPFSFFSVEVVDNNGNTVWGDTSEITVSLNSGSGALTGTLNKNAADLFGVNGGMVVFDDLSYDVAETIDISISSPGLQGLAATIHVYSENLIPTGLLTERVSVSSAGTQGNGACEGPVDISRDGRFIAFTSLSNNLISDDTNGLKDVFLHDRSDGTTVRTSYLPDGSQSYVECTDPVMSPNGRFVSYHYYLSGAYWPVYDSQLLLVRGFNREITSYSANNLYWTLGLFIQPLHLWNMDPYQWIVVDKASDGTEGNLSAGKASISSDGRFVVFWSNAGNLISNDTNGIIDIFVHDRDADEDGIFDEPGGYLTARVNESTAGTQATSSASQNPHPPSISSDGRYVTFHYTSASGLVSPSPTAGSSNVYVRDRDVDDDGIYDELGQVLTFGASVSSAGTFEGGKYPSMSSDGRYVVYESEGFPVEVKIHDNISGQTAVIATGAGPKISADGRYIAFVSDNVLVAGDTNSLADVYVKPNPLLP